MAFYVVTRQDTGAFLSDLVRIGGATHGLAVRDQFTDTVAGSAFYGMLISAIQGGDGESVDRVRDLAITSLSLTSDQQTALNNTLAEYFESITTVEALQSPVLAGAAAGRAANASDAVGVVQNVAQGLHRKEAAFGPGPSPMPSGDMDARLNRIERALTMILKD